LLARRRADPARPGRQDGGRDGTPADRRSARQPGPTGRATHRTQGLHPRQQHEPDPPGRCTRATDDLRTRDGSGRGRSRGKGLAGAMTAAQTVIRTESELDSFVEALRAQSRRYHDQHPFHVRMNAGRLSRRQLRGWVANRFYYQVSIPRKDAAILSNCPDHEVRRRWIRRITDHDGTTAGEGGIEAWLRLGEAAGLTREEIRDHRHLVPGVRFAVDAY